MIVATNTLALGFAGLALILAGLGLAALERASYWKSRSVADQAMGEAILKANRGGE